jgi:adenylate cyclase class 2
MPLEIEVKIKLSDHAAVRERLRELGAKLVGNVLETNTFFDTPTRSLLKEDRGLRLRTNKNLASGQSTHIITYKGPRAPGAVKKREEIEVSVGNPSEAMSLFEALGYSVTLSFEKRRETWQLDDCTIELDDLPRLGTYLEIEGPSEDSVLALRSKVNLDGLPTITEPYVALLEAELARSGTASRMIKF